MSTAKFAATPFRPTGKQIAARGEDPAAFDALIDELYERYQPDFIEAFAVDQLALSSWRLRRAESLQSEVMSRSARCGIAAALRDLKYFQEFRAAEEKEDDRNTQDEGLISSCVRG